MNLGPTELIIILVIVLVIFGGAKLPKLARSLGEAQREFKRSSEEDLAEPGADPADRNHPGATGSTGPVT